MSISLTRYVDITSGVGASPVVPARDLIGRIFTANSLLPPQSFISFTNAAQVGAYFGLFSEEYLRAVFYFSWISKNLTQPQSIQFARWMQSAAAPSIYSLQGNATLLSAWTAISSGSFVLTMAGVTETLSAINTSAAGSLSVVATDIQAAINAAGATSQTGTTHTTTSVTSLSDTSGLSQGMSVIAADIPFGTTIASVDSSTAITLSQAATGSNTESITFNNGVWGNAVVTYSSSLGGFILTGGAAGVVTNPINVMVGGGGTDITGAGLLGWLPQQVLTNGQLISNGAIWSTGSAAETITQALTNSAAVSNNFGSFLFLTNLGLTQQNVVDAATWNYAENVLYMYCQAVTPANIAAWQAAVAAIGGIGLTNSPAISVQITGTLTSASTSVTGLTSNAGLTVGMPVSGSNIPAGTVITSVNSNGTGITISNAASGSATELITFTTLEFPEQFPMMILAATNYAAFNAVQNYEFQQVAGLTASVTDDSTADAYDSVNVNYYGATQQAGVIIAFYQQGLLQGASVNGVIVDMTAYANEIWLKDAAGVAIMNLLLQVNQVPANNYGVNQILAILQGVINQALNNGTISVGKTLTVAQQMYITAATGDPLAWYQVQNNGYWVDVVITSPSPNIFVATYTLIYSKDDVIRKVIGTHTLI